MSKRYRARPHSRLASLRQDCHAAFDVHWQLGGVSRGAAYRWLANELGMEVSDCHFGMMSEAECEKALRVLRSHGPANPPDPSYAKLLGL